MCDCQRTRREFVVGALAVAAAGFAGRAAAESSPDTALADAVPAALDVGDGLQIHPRSDWAAGRPPRGPMGAEDVRFLLIHHTASSNHVPDPRMVIQQTYDFHTSAQKGWPDICYNFMIGPDGSIWETRAGSLAGPVIGDATGGNQGYSQLICLIGNFMEQAPTDAAQISLMKMLIFLADRYDVDTDPSATVSFVSRGSNKFRAGTPITVSTISGHRDVTYTACPGDVAYGLLPWWRTRVNATRLVRDEPGPLHTARRLNVHIP